LWAGLKQFGSNMQRELPAVESSSLAIYFHTRLGNFCGTNEFGCIIFYYDVQSSTLQLQPAKGTIPYSLKKNESLTSNQAFLD
jgi:hypothetical protein